MSSTSSPLKMAREIHAPPMGRVLLDLTDEENVKIETKVPSGALFIKSFPLSEPMKVRPPPLFVDLTTEPEDPMEGVEETPAVPLLSQAQTIFAPLADSRYEYSLSFAEDELDWRPEAALEAKLSNDEFAALHNLEALAFLDKEEPKPEPVKTPSAPVKRKRPSPPVRDLIQAEKRTRSAPKRLIF
jgi:hypothetical protein